MPSNHFTDSQPLCATSLHLPAELSRRLITKVTATHTTVFRVILAALYCYFTRTSRQPVTCLPNCIPASFLGRTDFRLSELLQELTVTQRSQQESGQVFVGELNGAITFKVTQLDQLDTFELNVEYPPQAFDADEIALLPARWQHLLHEMVDHPDRLMCDLSLLPAAEQHKILEEWNDTARPYPDECGIHQLFEQQVEKTPNAIALVFDKQHLTYHELNCRANQLAHHLQRQGVKPDTLVGLSLERSCEMIIGLLGILKAGGAYLPLDPSYPAERLKFMLHDAQVSLLVTQASLVQQLPLSNIQVICLDTDWQIIEPESEENPISAVTAEHLAYSIYTSGSTGQPKGVLLTHRGVCNLAIAEIELFNLQPTSRVVQFASLSFDASVAEIFPTLCAGARLCLATSSTLLPGYSLIEFLQQQAITHATLPPSALAVLPQVPLPALQILIVGGEVCSAKLVAHWAVGRRFFNAYGPTEVTVDATVAECVPNRPVSIGRPLANVQVYILDEQQQPVPIGVAGELYIGGVGLAKGYRHRPDLTAQKFIQNPFDSSQRLYRTGDLARYQADGNIEFLGRNDNQVKVRGFRIELGEVEAVLEEHPAVRQAVVLTQADKSSNPQLIAFVLPHLVSLNEAEQEKAQQDYIALWLAVNQQIDTQSLTQADPTFNIFGWNSSYSGQAIPAAEMQEWVEQTVARIRALTPQKVLEIGCGTGLLLSRIAPNCQEYVGIDFSGPALDYIRQTQQVIPGLDRITLLERTADDLADLPAAHFDTIIINSVVQHFPTVSYLLRVLTGAIKLIKPGGHLFIGDIRNLALLDTYCTSVELYRSLDTVECDQLQQRIQRRRRTEEELLLHPDFFLSLQQQFPEITHVQIKLKRGRYHNELTRFRYEAILHIGTAIEPRHDISWLDWQVDHLTLANLRQILTETQPQVLGIRNIPNQRLQDEVFAMHWLNQAAPHDSVNQLRTALSQQAPMGVEPEALWDLSEEQAYHIEISWFNTDSTGIYDVVLTDQSLPVRPVVFRANSTMQSAAHYTNNPLQTQFNQQLIPQLRQLLQAKLPDYMLPTALGVLERLPLTPNDKVDRQALAKLPADYYLSSGKADAFTAPRTLEESRLERLWADVLELEQVSIHDNFFELGGNSLKVIVLLNRLQEQLGKSFQMIDLFNAPTIALFADGLGEKTVSPAIERSAVRGERDRYYYPASLSQKRFWSNQAFHSPGSFETSPNICQLTGTLDQATLEKSLNEIIRRHEILRTTLQEVDGELIQIVAQTATVQISVINLQTLPEQEQQLEIERFTQQESQRPKSLEKDSWFHVTLLQLGEESHLLQIWMHPLISDGKSIDILLQELIVLYEAFLVGNSSPLPELPIQYGDYARWQQRSLTPEVLQDKFNYWQHWFSQEPEQLKFPTHSCATETFQGDVLEQQLSSSLTQKLKALGQQRQVTLFTTILAAFAVLHYPYSNEAMVIGVPATTRSNRALESLIGDFGKMLLLQIHMSKNVSFGELLNQVHQEMLRVLEKQDIPFGQLAQLLKVKRQRQSFPFSVSVFVDFLPDELSKQWKLDNLTITSLPPLKKSLTTKDLGLLLWEKITSSEPSLQFWWCYRKDVFDVETIAQMSEDFQTLLEAIVTAPEQPIVKLIPRRSVRGISG